MANRIWASFTSFGTKNLTGSAIDRHWRPRTRLFDPIFQMNFCPVSLHTVDANLGRLAGGY